MGGQHIPPEDEPARTDHAPHLCRELPPQFPRKDRRKADVLCHQIKGSVLEWDDNAIEHLETQMRRESASLSYGWWADLDAANVFRDGPQFEKAANVAAIAAADVQHPPPFQR